MKWFVPWSRLRRKRPGGFNVRAKKSYGYCFCALLPCVQSYIFYTQPALASLGSLRVLYWQIVWTISSPGLLVTSFGIFQHFSIHIRPYCHSFNAFVRIKKVSCRVHNLFVWLPDWRYMIVYKLDGLVNDTRTSTFCRAVKEVKIWIVTDKLTNGLCDALFPVNKRIKREEANGCSSWQQACLQN